MEKLLSFEPEEGTARGRSHHLRGWTQVFNTIGRSSPHHQRNIVQAEVCPFQAPVGTSVRCELMLNLDEKEGEKKEREKGEEEEERWKNKSNRFLNI